MGCDRILTSGQQPGAPGGVELITALNKAADHRIIIMPGSGVRKENIRSLADQTGCTEFHSSLRGKVKSNMDFIHPAFASSQESYMNNAIDPEEVRELRNALK
jgi:copper homeostasis protein